MSTMIDITPSLAVTSIQAERYRKLCHRYGLSPDATADALEAAILRKGMHTGYGHAIIAMQADLGSLAQGEKRAYNGGDEAFTLGD